MSIADFADEDVVRTAEAPFQREVVGIEREEQNRGREGYQRVLRLPRPRDEDEDCGDERYALHLARAAVLRHALDDALHDLDVSLNGG